MAENSGMRTARHDALFRLLSIPPQSREIKDAWMAFMEEVGCSDRRALRRCISAAGNPDPAEGCRQVIRIAQGALEAPDFRTPGDEFGV